MQHAIIYNITDRTYVSDSGIATFFVKDNCILTCFVVFISKTHTIIKSLTYLILTYVTDTI